MHLLSIIVFVAWLMALVRTIVNLALILFLCASAGRRVLRLVFERSRDAGTIGALVHSPVAVAPLAYAQKLTGMRGRITRLFVQAVPGRGQKFNSDRFAQICGGNALNAAIGISDPAANDAPIAIGARNPAFSAMRGSIPNSSRIIS